MQRLLFSEKKKTPTNLITILCEQPDTKALKKKPGLEDEESKDDF